MEKHTPTMDRVVLNIKKNSTKEGGIQKADKDIKTSNKAKVVAVGPLCQSAFKEGDTVVFSLHSGYSIDEDHLVINEKDIWAIVGE